ncbi:MAG: hypothetical protein E7259_03230 [Lachnospiraceae bacterium]|nr:hypothetical protein [Lachnospiraceae bacterium]
MSKKTIIKGTLILTIAGIITKLLGFYNRIFLTRLIGVKELGVYQLIFPIYMLAFSICCQGIATTLTKQVSFYMGKKCPNNAKKIFKYSIIISTTAGTFISILIHIFAYPLSLVILKNTNCAPLLKIISIAIPFVCAKSCINSYFLGIDKPMFQGISHLFEQVVRISTAYFLSVYWMKDKINASLAVLAVVTGELFATFLAILIFVIYTRKNKHNGSLTHDNPKTLISRLRRDAIPITTNNVIFTLFSSLESILMPAMLFYYYNNSETAMEMFGIITGIVIPFLLFPSTITNSLSTMLLPAVSYASARKNNKAINSALKNSLSFCFLLGVCTWIFYLLFGETLCIIAFKNKEAGILLNNMCYLCPLIYISGNLSAIMNGIDKAFNNLIFNVISIIIRIIFIVSFVPSYGLSAYVLGMTVSYIILDILLLTSVNKRKSGAS